jgi:hypothetical protein
MFKRRTLFVIGAGASAEAKLPIGSELAGAISKRLDIRFDDFGSRHVGLGDIRLFDNLKRKQPDKARDIQQACWLIRDGVHLSNSIDDFLDLHRDNATLTLVGKAAVAKSILEAENASSLHYDWRQPGRGINFPNLHPTWFNKFVKMLSRGVQKPDAIFAKVSFVVFNYDRCIEHFLLHGLQRLYGISEQDAASICATLSIRHPYGMLAPLATSTSPKGVRSESPMIAITLSLPPTLKPTRNKSKKGRGWRKFARKWKMRSALCSWDSHFLSRICASSRPLSV